MTELISAVSTVFTAVIGWAGDIGETIVGTPLLMAGVSIFFVGAAIGIFGRLLHRG